MVEYKTDATGVDSKQFSGTLNCSSITVGDLGISSGANSGWHLLGNPFSSALKWGTSDWSLTHFNATAKIWKESTAAYIDIASGTGIIPALNGFMVQVTSGNSGNNSLTIPTAARVHDETAWYKSSERPSILLVANDITGQTAQESIITFDGQATAGFDPAFDAHFLPGYAPQFYSVAGAEQLSTNTLPEAGGTVQVPFNFVKNNGDNFTIGAKTISGIQGPVILNDIKTGATQDLTLNPVYSFTSATGDDPSRFLIIFSHLGIMDGQKDNTFTIFANSNSIFVIDNMGKNQGSVFVYNTMGQLLTQRQLAASNQTIINLDVNTGYYLVKVITGNNAYSGKVFINK